MMEREVNISLILEFKKFKAMIRKSMKIIKYDVDAKRVEDLKN